MISNKKFVYLDVFNLNITEMNGRILMPLFTVLFLFVMLACEKEKTDPMPIGQDEVILKINALVESANDRFLSERIKGDEDISSFRIENEGLIDEYTANSKDFTESRPQKNVFLVCLRSVEPNQEQRPLLGRALQAYSERNERIIRSHRESYQKLKERMENARKQLYQRFESGEINREQYSRQILELRKLYENSMARIKASNAESFSRSYKLLLTHISKVLSDKQWEVLSDCIK
jgi:hypothetical protein